MSREFYEKEYHFDEDIEVLDFRRIRHFFKKVCLTKKKRYLDVGSGVGWALKYCHDQELTCVGFDISTRAIRLSEKLLPKTIQTLVADGEKLPFSSASFDIVSSLGVIEHFNNPADGIIEIHRILKPGGYALVVVPNSFWILNKLHVYTGTEQPQEMLASYEQWGRMFYKHGLKLCNVSSDIGPKIFKNKNIIGIVKRLLLKITLLLPVQFAYQYIFVFKKI